MHITEVSTPVTEGAVYFYTAVLFEDYEHYIAGPSGPDKHKVVAELQLYHGVVQATLIQAYVPHIH
jgi:hypothetical protein